MKSIKRCLISLVLILTSILFLNCSNTYARVQSNDPTVESGGTVKITLTTSNAVSCFKASLIDSGDLTFQSVSKSSNFENGSSNGTTINGATTGSPSTTLATYVFKAPEVSSNKNYTVKFSVTGMDAEDDTTNTSTVTVKAPAAPEPTPEPENNPTTPTEPAKPTETTPTEPNFTNANKKMYTTGEVNLRSTWSTSSEATKVEKGTEVTVIGTSTDKVNGYVWYRVSYNGKTKYIASSLLTSEKPEDKEQEKSNNKLKVLAVDGFSISPSFDAETLEYSLQVGMDVDKLDITAEAEAEKATVKIQGNQTLAEGENTIKIIVTAEDGTTKTYTLNVTKQDEIFGLQSLNIKGTDIENMFKTDVYDYEIKIEDLDKLDIEAIATSEDAIIEILGNEDLQVGENVITIIVKSADEKQTITYQIKVIKSLAAPAVVEDGNNINMKKVAIFAGIAFVSIVALIGVVVYTIKHRGELIKHKDYEDDFNYFPDDLPEKSENEFMGYEETIENRNQTGFEYEEDNTDDYVEDTVEEYDEDATEESIEEENETYIPRENKSNYFLEDPEEWDDYKPKKKKGKHF